MSSGLGPLGRAAGVAGDASRFGPGGTSGSGRDHAVAVRLRDADRWAAPVLVAGLGTAVALILASGARSDLRTLALGAAAAGTALVLLLAAGWIDGLVLVVLSLPLPAILSTNSMRLTAAAPVTAAVVLAWALRHGVAPRRLSLAGLPRGSALLLLAAFLVATVFGDELVTSVREVTNFGILLAFLVVARDELHGTPGRVDRLVVTLVAIGAATGALAVLEGIGVIPGEFPRFGTPYNRAALGFGQPNNLGLFLAMVLPLGAYGFGMAHSRVGRATAAGALALAAMGVVATFSRGAWLSLLLGTFPLVFTGDRRFVLRVWVTALAVALFLDLASGGALRDTAVRTVGDWVLEQRATLMLAGILMFLAHPLVGVGPGGYASALERFGAGLPQLFDYQPTPHNAYVQMAAETGVVGLLAFLVFLGAALIRLMRSQRATDATSGERARGRALLWSFGVACVAGLVVWPFSHGTGQVVMLVLAMAFAVAPAAPGSRPTGAAAAARATDRARRAIDDATPVEHASRRVPSLRPPEGAP